MPSLTKAVIPAAGFGTRMLPAAKAVPKEMLPILDRPVIQYVVEEAAEAGISQAVLVTAPGKEAMERHFAPAPLLQERLRRGGRADLLASVEALRERIRVGSVLQEEQLGLGHAVLMAEAAVGDEPFACLLGDTVFSATRPGDPLPCAELAAAHARLGGAVIGLETVPAERVSRYGIIGGAPIDDVTWRIDRIIEKPGIAEAPSRLAVAARYVFSPGIFDCLRRTAPGKGGEIQLTDAIALLIEREPVHGVILSARRHDVGNPADWLATNLAFATRDPALLAVVRSMCPQ
jgi:UTP--glucose-1-phosphate uridylyltransferase